MTGGSDYHGEAKVGVQLGTGRNGNLAVPRAVLDRMRERARPASNEHSSRRAVHQQRRVRARALGAHITQRDDGGQGRRKRGRGDFPHQLAIGFNRRAARGRRRGVDGEPHQQAVDMPARAHPLDDLLADVAALAEVQGLERLRFLRKLRSVMSSP